MTEPTRRRADHLPLDIDAMIIAEPDPKQRAFLIVLSSINSSLQASTETIKHVSDKLDKHLTNFETHANAEEALMNKGRGMWKLAAWVIGVAQVVGVLIWTDTRTDLVNIHRELVALVARDATFDTRISVLERGK